MTDEDEPTPADAGPPPAEQAAREAAAAADKAAKKARKAQQKADRLAAEAQRLAGTDEPQAAPAVEAAPAASGVAAAPPARTRGPLAVAAGLLVACAAFLVVAVVVHVGGGDSSRPAAEVRDAALLAARQDIVVLNSLDYRNIDAGLHRWLDASTGELHASFGHVTAADRKRIADAKAVTTARILDAAMVSLDAANGHATVIASVELTVTPASGKAVVKRERQRADVTRVGAVWKVSGLQQVGVTVQ